LRGSALGVGFYFFPDGSFPHRTHRLGDGGLKATSVFSVHAIELGEIIVNFRGDGLGRAWR
jgi:hypothetical protein